MTAIEARLAGEWAQVRSLHHPEDYGTGTAYCAHCGSTTTPELWPCATARIVYTPAEIERETM